jgi:hypothetical protein
MSVWNKDEPAEPDRSALSEPVRRDGKELPGIAGYRGTDPLPKNAMPVVRFKYVRPDGKPE